MQLVVNPHDSMLSLQRTYFGDILSDEGAVISGSIGLTHLHPWVPPVPLYEPVTYGSAPDIMGQNLANPLGTICCDDASSFLDFALTLLKVL